MDTKELLKQLSSRGWRVQERRCGVGHHCGLMSPSMHLCIVGEGYTREEARRKALAKISDRYYEQEGLKLLEPASDSMAFEKVVEFLADHDTLCMDDEDDRRELAAALVLKFGSVEAPSRPQDGQLTLDFQ